MDTAHLYSAVVPTGSGSKWNSSKTGNNHCFDFGRKRGWKTRSL